MSQIDLINTDNSVSSDSLQAIVDHFADRLKINLDKRIIEIKFVNDSEMLELNNRYRQINQTTDVLSFPQTHNSTPQDIYGSIVISPEEAKKRHEPVDQLVLHGLLHLAGYDHEIDLNSWNWAAGAVGHDLGIFNAKI